MADARYQALLAKIDSKAQALEEMHRPQLRCARSCHSCCKPGLGVFGVEAEHIREYLAAHPELQERALENEREDPHAGQRCSFLDASGSCLIYPVRPVVCRTHGLPLEIRDEEKVFRDVCPLNFQGQSLAALDGAGVLNLQLINTLLTLINQESQGPAAEVRWPLKASAI